MLKKGALRLGFVLPLARKVAGQSETKEWGCEAQGKRLRGRVTAVRAVVDMDRKPRHREEQKCGKATAGIKQDEASKGEGSRGSRGRTAAVRATAGSGNNEKKKGGYSRVARKEWNDGRLYEQEKKRWRAWLTAALVSYLCTRWGGAMHVHWTVGCRFGEARHLGPYSVGGSSSSGLQREAKGEGDLVAKNFIEGERGAKSCRRWQQVGNRGDRWELAAGSSGTSAVGKGKAWEECSQTKERGLMRKGVSFSNYEDGSQVGRKGGGVLGGGGDSLADVGGPHNALVGREGMPDDRGGAGRLGGGAVGRAKDKASAVRLQEVSSWEDWRGRCHE